jgi:hypothetical protein
MNVPAPAHFFPPNRGSAGTPAPARPDQQGRGRLPRCHRCGAARRQLDVVSGELACHDRILCYQDWRARREVVLASPTWRAQ